jgi:hypothetical protein
MNKGKRWIQTILPFGQGVWNTTDAALVAAELARHCDYSIALKCKQWNYDCLNRTCPRGFVKPSTKTTAGAVPCLTREDSSNLTFFV